MAFEVDKVVLRDATTVSETLELLLEEEGWNSGSQKIPGRIKKHKLGKVTSFWFLSGCLAKPNRVKSFWIYLRRC